MSFMLNLISLNVLHVPCLLQLEKWRSSGGELRTCWQEKFQAESSEDPYVRQREMKGERWAQRRGKQATTERKTSNKTSGGGFA